MGKGQNRQLLELSVLVHPDIADGLIASSDVKAKKAIQELDYIWKREEIDPSLFTIEKFEVIDHKLKQVIFNAMPELML